MRVEDRLDKGTRKKEKHKDHKKKHQEKLSRRDIEGLMGVHRPIYYRSKGAYRQK